MNFSGRRCQPYIDEAVEAYEREAEAQGSTVRKGKLDDKGHAQLTNVPPGEYTVEFGEDPRDWEAPPLPEPEHRKAEVREQGRLAVEQARAEYERGQA